MPSALNSFAALKLSIQPLKPVDAGSTAPAYNPSEPVAFMPALYPHGLSVKGNFSARLYKQVRPSVWYLGLRCFMRWWEPPIVETKNN
jgi:hypothetical protein